ncbi:hypothetical protein ACTJJB_30125 [Chitinophaga sp. 22536]|uniref:hypothetical protein n=1 Tax=unclassified Chitinophaga TaxID=2619133 RepID=UPI003F85803F
MIAANDEIYNIFRKDLHLSEEKTRQLVSKMDTAINKAQADKFALKSEVSEVSIKLGLVQDEMKEIKVEVKQMREKLEEIVTTLSGRVALYITIAVALVGLLIRFLK